MLRAGRVTHLVLAVVFICALFIYIRQGRKIAGMQIRRVAGLDALDEAIGRATEMGKNIHYTMGMQAFEAQTFAAFEILRYTAGVAAKMDVPLIVTNFRPEVHPVTEEIVRGAFTAAGKPDAYQPDNVRFMSDNQLAYASGVIGVIERENIAANLMFGNFFAESLIFAETGQKMGCIQVAGTANTHQLPFFTAVCDYTLIGEELFAAGAYLSHNPIQVGSLMAQDIGKLIALFLMLVGTAMASVGQPWLRNLIAR